MKFFIVCLLFAGAVLAEENKPKTKRGLDFDTFHAPIVAAPEVYHHEPAIAAPVYHAPIAKIIAPAATSFHTQTIHHAPIVAHAPLIAHAPVVAHAAPIVAHSAPLLSSYHAAPLYTEYHHRR